MWEPGWVGKDNDSVYYRAWKRAYVAVLGLTGDVELAEELAQQGLLETLDRIVRETPGIQAAEHVLEARFEMYDWWVSRVAIYRARNELRRKERPVDPADLAGLGRALGCEPAEAAIREELCRFLNDLIRTLPDLERQALRARVEKTGYQDVADKNHVVVATVSRAADRALKTLRRELNARGVGPSVWSLPGLRDLELDWRPDEP